jgi:hypothetical protein
LSGPVIYDQQKKQKGKKLKDKIICLIGLWFEFRKKLKAETWYLKENSYNKNSNIRFLTLAELLQTKSYLKLTILLQFVHRWLFCINFIFFKKQTWFIKIFEQNMPCILNEWWGWTSFTHTDDKPIQKISHCNYNYKTNYGVMLKVSCKVKVVIRTNLQSLRTELMN